MKKLILIFAISIMVVGCGTKMDTSNEKSVLMETDRAFSKMSAEKGIYEAFDYYMADDAVMYREGKHPFKGRETIRPILSKNPDAKLTWEPTFADVAKSGEIGYTLGRWDFVMKDSAGIKNTGYGYYISVWKKQPDGSWKWVFDSGISGPGEDSTEG